MGDKERIIFQKWSATQLELMEMQTIATTNMLAQKKVGLDGMIRK